MRRLPTLLAVVSVLVIVAVLGGYGAYWFVLAGQIEQGIQRWEAERRAEGWTVDHGPIARSGFPFVLDLEMPSPALKRSDPPVSWRGERLQATLKPVAPGEIGFTFAGKHQLVLPIDGQQRPLEAMLGTGVLDLRLDGRGRAEAVALNVNNVDARFTDTSEQFHAAAARFVVRRHEVANDAKADPRTALAMETDTRIEGLHLPPRMAGLMGQEIPLVAALANLIGPLPSATTQAAMAAWRDAGSYVEVREFQLTWGKLQIQGAGNARLDAQLQAAVQLDCKVRGADALIDALVMDRQLSLPEGLLAKAGLFALMRPGENGEPPYLRVPITVRDGNRIYLGPVRVARLPPLLWRP